MSILITGGTGLIGSYLARQLVSEGYELILLDKFPNMRLIADIKDKIKIVRGDITNLGSIIEVLKKNEVEAIFHLAAIISASAEANPLGAFNVNVIGTINVLEAARIFEIKKFIFPSSSVVFTPGLESPVAENAPKNPNIIYGINKVTCEQWCGYYKRRYGLDIRGARFVSLIGAGRVNGGASRFASLMIEKSALNKSFEVFVDKDIRIPIIYVKDIVSALIALFKAKNVDRIFYNIGGITPSAGELSDEVNKNLPKANITFKPDPAMIKILSGWPNLDSTLIKKEVGWQLTYNLKAMVQDLITTVQSNNEIFQ
jgi:nucleoside-diphosphate-sugar epimerase